MSAVIMEYFEFPEDDRQKKVGSQLAYRAANVSQYLFKLPFLLTGLFAASVFSGGSSGGVVECF